jgi:hypothetical protein
MSGHAVAAALALVEAEVCALALVGMIALHDRVTGKRTLARLLGTAARLTGAHGHTWRRPLALARALWHGGPGTLPRTLRLVIAPGVFLPILGPIDEAAAAIAVALVALHPQLRQRVRTAWKEAV